MSVWTDVLDAIYGDPEFSIEISLQPALGGVPVILRALPDLADKADQFGQRRSVLERNVFRIRVHELVAKVPDCVPQKGDVVMVADQEQRLVNAPLHPDDRRLEWRLDCSI